jgi:hypothetical protein
MQHPTPTSHAGSGQPPPIIPVLPAATIKRLHPLLPLLGDLRPHLRPRVRGIARHAAHAQEPFPLLRGCVEAEGGEDDAGGDRHTAMFEAVLRYGDAVDDCTWRQGAD